MRSGKHRLDVFYTELAAAFKDRSQNPQAFYDAYHMYWMAKKLFAQTRWRKAYVKYMQTAAESDAHKVETLLRIQCEKLGVAVDRGEVRGCPTRDAGRQQRLRFRRRNRNPCSAASR